MKWKLYFWIYTVLTILGLTAVIPSLMNFNFGSYEGLVESILFIIGTYSYVYKKKVFIINFWRYFFVFILFYWPLQILTLIIPIEFMDFITPNIQGGDNLGMIIFSMIVTIPALISVYRLGKFRVFKC